MENMKSRSDGQPNRSRVLGDIIPGGQNQGSKRPRNGKRKLIVSSVATLLLAAIVVFGFMFYMPNLGSAVDSSKYQAVFLSNGQVYFGKLKVSNNTYVTLTDVFYIQTDTTKDTNQSTSTTADSNLQLIKLGSEVHGPEDEMVINKDQVLFFENIKNDGKVVDSITKYYAQKK
jgi:small nuclear ribonucleoprotein (snRNP)-like protein